MAHGNVLGYFDNTISLDLFRLLLGDPISHGMSRTVYGLLGSPDLVVKVETTAGIFQNVEEWQTWDALQDTPLGKWLAPCVAISPCGACLVQKRTKFADDKKFPVKIPKFFTDLKRSNFGLIGKRLVCHDYGHNLLRENHSHIAMQKADWWDEDAD